MVITASTPFSRQNYLSFCFFCMLFFLESYAKNLMTEPKILSYGVVNDGVTMCLVISVHILCVSLLWNQLFFKKYWRNF